MIIEYKYAEPNDAPVICCLTCRRAQLINRYNTCENCCEYFNPFERFSAVMHSRVHAHFVEKNIEFGMNPAFMQQLMLSCYFNIMTLDDSVNYIIHEIESLIKGKTRESMHSIN